MKKPYLFVGGEADGRIIDVGETCVKYLVPVRPPLYAGELMDTADALNLKTDEYRKLNISQNGYVYVLSHYTMQDVIGKLINSYRPVLV